MPILGQMIKQGEAAANTVMALLASVLPAMAAHPEYAKQLIALMGLLELLLVNVLTQTSTILKRVADTKSEKLATDLLELAPRCPHSVLMIKVECEC